jgi:catechol 2,3-dioxygenase-like lactoylglutathione lyase family enzyme
MATVADKTFEFRGVNHIALVCRDMAKTVEFYRDVLGMKLVKSLDLPENSGQHFFFDMGNGNCIAFFWFPKAPEAQPGISSPKTLPTSGDFRSAHGSLNHIAIDIAAEQFDEFYERLKNHGIEVSPVLNHDHSKYQVIREVTEDVYVRSAYFFDPDGVLLEIAAWTRAFREDDVAVDPRRADGTVAEGLVTSHLSPAE